MANYESNRRPYLLVYNPPEVRNPVIGLPENYYRPLTKEQKAGANGLLGLFVIGFLLASPLWVAWLFGGVR